MAITDSDRRIEWRREQWPNKPHGDVHLMLHTPGTPRSETAMCGVDTSGMRKQGTPFRNWYEVGCPECYRQLDL